MIFNENLIKNNKFVLKMQEIIYDFGAPSGQIQISLQFNNIRFKNGRFRSSHWLQNGRFRSSQWPDQNFIEIPSTFY